MSGIDGERSSLWFEMFRVICEIRPRFVFVENSPMLVCRGLDRVLGGLASVGYDAEWDVIGANAVGAPHHRERIWILAYDANRIGSQANRLYGHCNKKFDFWSVDKLALEIDSCPIWKSAHTGLDCLDDGLSERVVEYKGLGNAQVPIVAAMAFRILLGRINEQ